MCAYKKADKIGQSYWIQESIEFSLRVEMIYIELSTWALHRSTGPFFLVTFQQLFTCVCSVYLIMERYVEAQHTYQICCFHLFFPHTQRKYMKTFEQYLYQSSTCFARWWYDFFPPHKEQTPADAESQYERNIVQKKILTCDAGSWTWGDPLGC